MHELFDQGHLRAGAIKHAFKKGGLYGQVVKALDFSGKSLGPGHGNCSLEHGNLTVTLYPGV